MGQKLTIRQAAERLGLSDKGVRRAIARGDIRAYQMGSTNRLRVDADDVDALFRPLPTGGRSNKVG
ncbi:hypothetical protein XA26_27220 [Mycolicibacterium fortuitum]|uniref:Helix-turn-helix domain-containing protein n=1 Tax=Mycolicibacterium fortuitum TaxID=1766 RepID=A0A0N9XFR9_MYCFO|nr:helix-turn-helix domain-containing protein [Mycolicibacterium fortuitum]ALI26562.1 hypothetical protein XA26_27220 [Mycolicibacterium fortuitum]